MSDFWGLTPYPKKVEKKLREDFAPLVKQYLAQMRFADDYLWWCYEIYEAAAMKFLVDEFSDRGLEDFLQDFVLNRGIVPSQGTNLETLYDTIDPEWKWGSEYQQLSMRRHPAYNDVGPSNIAIKEYLEFHGIDPRTFSRGQYIEVIRLLQTDEETVEYTLKLVIQAVKDLKGHFTDKCCQYDRRSVELIVSYLRSGEKKFWSNVKKSKSPELYRHLFYLVPDEQFELWKASPENVTSDLIRKYVVGLQPGYI